MITRLDAAAMEGDLQLVIRYGQDPYELCTTNAMDLAAMCGHLEILQWLHDHRTEGCTTLAMDMAAMKKKWDIVKWLHDHRTESCTLDAVNWVIVYDDLEMLKWFYENQCEKCNFQFLLECAFVGNHDEILHWLLKTLKSEREYCLTKEQKMTLSKRNQILKKKFLTFLPIRHRNYLPDDILYFIGLYMDPYPI